MSNTTPDTDSPTFSDNWGHFYWMTPLIVFGALLVGHWEALPILTALELMLFAYHTRIHHPDHPIQKERSDWAVSIVIGVCATIALPSGFWRMNPEALILGNTLSGSMDRVVLLGTCIAIAMLSKLIHEWNHGKFAEAFHAYRQKGDSVISLWLYRLFAPIAIPVWCVMLRHQILLHHW